MKYTQAERKMCQSIRQGHNILKINLSSSHVSDPKTEQNVYVQECYRHVDYLSLRLGIILLLNRLEGGYVLLSMRYFQTLLRPHH